MIMKETKNRFQVLFLPLISYMALDKSPYFSGPCISYLQNEDIGLTGSYNPSGFNVLGFHLFKAKYFQIVRVWGGGMHSFLLKRKEKNIALYSKMTSYTLRKQN